MQSPSTPAGAHTSVTRPAFQTLRPIVADAQPGGRYAGEELPPIWFKQMERAVRIPSALPTPGDMPGVVEGVREMCLAIREEASRELAAGGYPVLIGGDHSLAMGTISAGTRHHGRMAVIWIDAHADFNVPETSPTGNPHGMPLSAACGLGDERLTSLFDRFVAFGDVVLIGARDIDPGEQELLTRHGVWHVPVAELRRLGIAQLVAQITAKLGDLPVHLSFDFDAISGEYFQATGTPVPEGLTPTEGGELLRALSASPLRFVGGDWVEYLPRHAHAEPSGNLAQELFEAFHGPAKV